jgi:hypothetical protein
VAFAFTRSRIGVASSLEVDELLSEMGEAAFDRLFATIDEIDSRYREPLKKLIASCRNYGRRTKNFSNASLRSDILSKPSEI